MLCLSMYCSEVVIWFYVTELTELLHNDAELFDVSGDEKELENCNIAGGLLIAN